jgi:hypothetical protein
MQLDSPIKAKTEAPANCKEGKCHKASDAACSNDEKQDYKIDEQWDGQTVAHSQNLIQVGKTLSIKDTVEVPTVMHMNGKLNTIAETLGAIHVTCSKCTVVGERQCSEVQYCAPLGETIVTSLVKEPFLDCTKYLNCSSKEATIPDLLCDMKAKIAVDGINIVEHVENVKFDDSNAKTLFRNEEENT